MVEWASSDCHSHCEDRQPGGFALFSEAVLAGVVQCCPTEVMKHLGREQYAYLSGEVAITPSSGGSVDEL